MSRGFQGLFVERPGLLDRILGTYEKDPKKIEARSFIHGMSVAMKLIDSHMEQEAEGEVVSKHMIDVDGKKREVYFVTTEDRSSTQFMLPGEYSKK